MEPHLQQLMYVFLYVVMDFVQAQKVAMMVILIQEMDAQTLEQLNSAILELEEALPLQIHVPQYEEMAL